MGSEDFVEKVQTLLNTKATNREVTEMQTNMRSVNSQHVTIVILVLKTPV